MELTETATFAACQDLLADEPQGSVPTHAMRVVFFIDGEDGKEKYVLAHAGEMTLSSWLGCLELLKEDFIVELRGERIEKEGD